MDVLPSIYLALYCSTVLVWILVEYGYSTCHFGTSMIQVQVRSTVQRTHKYFLVWGRSQSNDRARWKPWNRGGQNARKKAPRGHGRRAHGISGAHAVASTRSRRRRCCHELGAKNDGRALGGGGAARAGRRRGDGDGIRLLRRSGRGTGAAHLTPAVSRGESRHGSGGC